MTAKEDACNGNVTLRVKSAALSITLVARRNTGLGRVEVSGVGRVVGREELGR